MVVAGVAVVAEFALVAAVAVCAEVVVVSVAAFESVTVAGAALAGKRRCNCRNI